MITEPTTATERTTRPFAPTPTPRVLEWCLHLLVVGLLALAAVRAASDGRQHTAFVVSVAVVCGAVYSLGTVLRGVRTSQCAAAWWLAAVGLVWLALLGATPDAVWVAFALFFLQLHLLPRFIGLGAVVLTTVAAVAGFAAHRHEFGFAMAIGPALGAAVAVAVVWGYQALYRESENRRRLIEELTATRADLAELEHTAGVLAERDRLAREIHDTLAQGFSSIQLLLHAAERVMPTSQLDATTYLVQAREAAGDNLDEARRFVAALAPPALDGTTIADALERLCATTGARHRLAVRFQVVGDLGSSAESLSRSDEVEILRIAQSALSNTVRHAEATSVDVVLTYDTGGVDLEIVDDGRGFEKTALPSTGPDEGGFGIPAMRSRAGTLGAALVVDSAPGRGTALSLYIPATERTRIDHA